MPQRSTAQSFAPLVLAVVILWVMVAALALASAARTGGLFVYSLDDTYIHMAMARHFAADGVWGVTRHAFTSSSSSPLWTLLIALGYVPFGAGDLVPLALNVVFATLILVVVHLLLLRAGASPFYSFVVLLAFILLASLPPLVLTGLEHPLHILLTIGLCALGARALEGDRLHLRSRSGAILLALAFAASAVRYENLFLVAILSGLVILRCPGRAGWLDAIALGAAGAAPVVLYGLISLANGWLFLPNPVYLGGRLPDFSTVQGVLAFFGGSAYTQLVDNPHLLMLVLAALALFLIETQADRRLWRTPVVLLLSFLALTLLHVQFTRKSVWIYRHESYLIALGLFVLAAVLYPRLAGLGRPRSLTGVARLLAGGLLAALALLPLLERSMLLLFISPQASTNIYEQQMQMAYFLRDHYDGRGVALNDIGAVNYLADLRTLDLFGLASLPVGRALRDGSYDTALIERLVDEEEIAIALVYDHWYNAIGGLPSGWILVGQWTIADNIVTGGDTVSFYALHPSEIAPLRDALRRFAPRLPRTVRYSDTNPAAN